MEGAAAATAGIDDTQAEAVAACLRKVKCLPGSVMDHSPALRGLAAVGRSKAPAADDAPSVMSLVELETALRDAGSALLEQAGLLAGQRERGGVCAALQYLSFRCFCAVDVLHQAASGVSADAVPEGDALWGAIMGAWGSVRSGVNLEGALADLTRWWQGFEGAEVEEAGEGGPVSLDDGGEAAAADAALAGMRQQATWLRGEAAGDLRSEGAAEHLECAARAVEKLRGLLGCAPVLSGRKVKAVGGLDLAGGLECLNGKDVSVYSGKSRIEDEDVSGAGDVELWAASVEAGATALATSVSAVKRVEAARIAQGLPRIVQAPHMAAMMHSCAASRADEPLGERSSVTVQVQCEAGWPLRVFLEDEAWGDVGLDVKQRVAVRVLGVCAVAEACGVDVSGVGVGSFVVVGVGTGSVGDMVEALDGGGCEVVLGACGRVWDTYRSDGGRGDRGMSSVVREVLGVSGGALGGGPGVVSSFVSSGEGGEHALSNALEVLARGGSGCCMGAYAMACSGSEGGVGRLEGLESALRRIGGAKAAVAHKESAQADRAQAAEAGAAWVLTPRKEAVKAEAAQAQTVQSGVVRALAASAQAFEAMLDRAQAERAKAAQARVEAEAAVAKAAAMSAASTLHSEQTVEQVRFSEKNTTEFVVACKEGKLARVRELLALTGAEAVDVHAADEGGPEAAFRGACQRDHTSVVLELLKLTGDRKIPDRTRRLGITPEVTQRLLLLNIGKSLGFVR